MGDSRITIVVTDENNEETVTTTDDPEENEMDSISQGRPPLVHQSSSTQLQKTTATTSSNGVDRKALRQTLYSGIFYKHRRTIFALGSFLRMLRTRNSDYNAIKGEPDTE